MPEEREIKIPVGADFVLPDLDGVVEGTRAVDRGTRRTLRDVLGHRSI